MLDLIIPSAMAQGANAAQQPNAFMSLAPFAIIFVIFYFLMLKPQQKKLKEEQAMIAALGKGDEVYTKSGVLGTIVGITDKIVTLEVNDGVKFKILKSHIGGPSSQIFKKEEQK